MTAHTEIKQEHPNRPVWLALVGGTLVWFLHFNIDYPLTSLACRWGWFPWTVAGMPGLKVVQLTVSIVSAVIVAALGLSCLREWRRAGSDEDDEKRETESARVSFMAFVTALLNGLYLVIIVLSFVPVLTLNPCG
jgi:hypothetical protein